MRRLTFMLSCFGCAVQGCRVQTAAHELQSSQPVKFQEEIGNDNEKQTNSKSSKRRLRALESLLIAAKPESSFKPHSPGMYFESDLFVGSRPASSADLNRRGQHAATMSMTGMAEKESPPISWKHSPAEMLNPERHKVLEDITREANEPEHIDRVFDRLLSASELLDDDQRVVLTAEDISTALADMHLHREVIAPNGVAHPSTFLPPSLYSGESVDITDLVRTKLPEVFAAHPIFLFMVEETIGNDDFYKSVYFGIEERDESSLDFSQLCRRFVASVYIFEVLISLDCDDHRRLAQWYEALYEANRGRGPPPRSARDALMGFWLALKGESVLASVNAFEMMRRLRENAKAVASEVKVLSDVLNAIMKLNLVEAIISNLSFAYWPDNARAGMALLLTQLGDFRADLTQDLDDEWFSLYLAWNANFIWPSHYCPDMMCFTMLAMPTIALGKPENFQYNRAHTLFWVVRSSQLTRMLSPDEHGKRAAAFGVSADTLRQQAQQVPCFHCRQLEPSDDRQPLTSRTAVLTRASGEALARKAGLDVSDSSNIWWRLATEVVPQQLLSALQIYGRMPKSSVTKLKLL